MGAARRVRGKCPRRGRVSRRGVASVLAVMFLIIFGSLVAAMGVASTGNIRTATVHLHVLRAMSAAETGMAVAEDRLDEACARFVVSKGEIDADMVRALWTGDAGAIGTHTVLAPPSGFAETGSPDGIAEALRNRFNADENVITGAGFIDAATIASAPAGVTEGVYSGTDWVYTPAVALEAMDETDAVPPPAFQIQYAPLADWSGVRVIVEGMAFDFARGGEPIRRTITRDFRLTKRIDHAIISNTRVLIGKNVSIEGDMGTRFDQVDFPDADPVVMRSDFEGLDPVLDLKLQMLYDALAANDIDEDNRLRVGHPIEGAGIPADDDFDHDGENDGAFTDATGDGYVDDFDVFINHFDKDHDHRVTLSTALTDGTPAAGRSPEFVYDDGTPIDEALALMIDSAHPDRNANGRYGWTDTDNDGYFDAGTEFLVDWDPNLSVYADQVLGYRDGFLDAMDRYAKVSGTIYHRVTQPAWIDGQGDYRPRVQGPIDPATGKPPKVFDAGDDVLPPIGADSFEDAENDLLLAADGDDFWQQVADQLGVATTDLTHWTTAMNPGGADDPWFRAVWADTNNDGLPDNAGEAYHEQSPYNSPNYADIYFRPVFRNFVFRNVEIPMGLNALFESCTFVGATRVRAYTHNTHRHWNLYGALDPNGGGIPTVRFPRYVYGDDAYAEPYDDAPSALDEANSPPEVFPLLTLPSISPLDKGDVRVSEQDALVGLSYASLPDPLYIDGVRVVDTKPYSNNIRFHDCLVVGSIVSDTPEVYTQVRNKLQFTGATRFAPQHPDAPDDGYLNPDEADEEILARSSMMAPNYSVDIGSYNAPQAQDVRLHGAIIAGVLDVRGNTSIDGALILTFNPVRGEAPLVDALGDAVGNPADFNASLGYHDESVGDYESINPANMPVIDGQRIAGWDTNGDGLIDIPSTSPQPPGSTPIPFEGYGRVVIHPDPDLVLPDGLMLPISAPPIAGSYREGSY